MQSPVQAWASGTLYTFFEAEFLNALEITNEAKLASESQGSSCLHWVDKHYYHPA